MAKLAAEREAVRAVVDAVTAEAVVAPRDSVAYRILQPARLGGAALPAQEFIAAIGEIAALDGFRSWLIAGYNAAAYEVAQLRGDAADEIWGADPAALVAASYRAEGNVDGDGRLSGHWRSVVGADAADWLLLSTSGARRVLLPRGAVRADPIGSAGLDGAGVADVTVREAPVGGRHIFGGRDSVFAVAGAGMAAAAVGAADGVWRKCVDQMRGRLATSYGGEQVTGAGAAQLARAASDIDAAKLQVVTSLEHDGEVAAATWACHQAVVRARDAADRLLTTGRYALAASDPVISQWRAVHTGAGIAARHLADLNRAPVLRIGD